MGRRELLIALAFIVVGVVAYQLTAPPAAEGRGFSLRDLWNRARTNMREDSARARITHSETLALTADVREIRLVEVPRGLKIIGEDRDDLAYELMVESTGPTEDAAAEYARRTRLIADALGEALTLRVGYPEEGRQTSQLAVRLPRRLAVRLQTVREATVSGVSAVHLEGGAGDTQITDIPGAISGMFSNGELTVSRAASVKLTLLQGTRADFETIADGLTIDARNGEVRITGSKGPIDMNGVNEEITIREHAGPVRIGGSGGQVEVDDPHEESRVDMRRTEVRVTLHRAIASTLLTTDEPLTLVLAGDLAIALDAVATDGSIEAADFSLAPEKTERDQRLSHAFAPAATTRVSLRNLRGNIVIVKSK